MSNASLPTGLLVDSVLSPLNAQGIFYYIAQKGNTRSGLILLKLNALDGRVKVLMQQRNFMSDEIEWINPLRDEIVDEKQADMYLMKQRDIDPDLWIIEIEDQKMRNPFSDFT